MAKNTSIHGATSLGLVGDGDDVDLLRQIEDSFSVTFGSETSRWTTVGDIYHDLLKNIPVAINAGNCSTMMAFYRVRSSLFGITGIRRIAPSTELREVLSIPPKQFFRRLSSDIGISPPSIQLSWRGEIGSLGSLAGVLAIFASIVFHGMWPTMILLPIGALMIATDSGSFGPMTVGDLARTIAIKNFHYFAEAGADHRPQEIWRALCGILAEECCIEPTFITAETRLLD